MNGTDCVIVCTTLPADADAEAFARALVEARLAACVSVLPGVRSVYRWQVGVETDMEQQLLIKTATARVEALLQRIRERHPYSVPELLVLPVGGDSTYREWIRASTTPAAGDDGAVT